MTEIRVTSVQPLRMRHIAPSQGELDRQRARQLVEENLTMAVRLLTQAGELGCDIVCYPEDIQGIGHYGYYLDDPELFSGFAEPVHPGSQWKVFGNEKTEGSGCRYSPAILDSGTLESLGSIPGSREPRR